MSRQVTCIDKRDRNNPHERITHIGGRRWKVTQRQAIREIEADPKAFYVSVGNRSVALIVRERKGVKYLTTKPDGSTQDNLLALRKCS